MKNVKIWKYDSEMYQNSEEGEEGVVEGEGVMGNRSEQKDHVRGADKHESGQALAGWASGPSLHSGERRGQRDQRGRTGWESGKVERWGEGECAGGLL